jgi:HK97 gp10 family phage protein
VNTDRLIRRLEQIPIEARKGIGAALARAVVSMDSYAKEKIQGGARSGRVYRRRSVTHQASAPGEFPKSDMGGSGGLTGSLFFRVAADKLSAIWGTALNYGKYLEFGTSRMAARPWMRPTLQANEDKISADIQREVSEALKKASKVG